MTIAYGLIQPADLSLPELPDSLEGLKIAHLSDIHITRHRDRHNLLINQLASIRLDLVVLTGDYMTRKGDEPHAIQMLERMLGRVKPKYGSYGVFGNHDSMEFREKVKQLPISWLSNLTCRAADGVIELFGLDTNWPSLSDAASLVLDWKQKTRAVGTETFTGKTLRLMISHFPTCLATASDIGINLVLAGHTHGGQCRLPYAKTLLNACDLPLKLSSGLIRHRNTLMAISRGLGEANLPIRAFCPAHVPVYTLHKRAMQGINTNRFDLLWKW